MESLTAKLCSFARAWHSSHSDHTVFNDFLALDFMGQEEYEKVSNFILKRFPQESENSIEFFNRKYFLPIVLSRSRFAEDRVKLESQSGKIQYVICGAGVDTFSFRNKNPNVEVFELDLLATQSYKKKRIQELHWNIAENVHFVAIDFSKDRISKANCCQHIGRFILSAAIRICRNDSSVLGNRNNRNFDHL